MRTHLLIAFRVLRCAPLAFVLRRASLAFVLLAAACSGSEGGGGSGSSGLQSSKRLIDLTAAENAQLCDWAVGKVGSYGNPGTCDRTATGVMAVALIYDDQAACVADAPDPTSSCTGTVAQMEACVNSLPACATLENLLAAPACAAVLAC
jgi:hypothetical protein